MVILFRFVKMKIFHVIVIRAIQEARAAYTDTNEGVPPDSIDVLASSYFYLHTLAQIGKTVLSFSGLCVRLTDLLFFSAKKKTIKFVSSCFSLMRLKLGIRRLRFCRRDDADDK